jgi:hypothetical protein
MVFLCLDRRSLGVLNREVLVMPKSDDILTAFGESTRLLIERLHENPRLNMVEQMFIESHLSLIRSAFEGWKRRNTTSKK